MKLGYRQALAAAVALSVMAGAGAASAQGLGGGAFYLKGFGGWTFPDDDTFQFNDRGTGASASSGLNYDTGYTLGVAGGFDLTPNVAVELEYAYRNTDADLKGTSDKGTTESNAWMVNALYNFTSFGANGEWRPYVGAGLGVADLSVEKLDLSGDFDSDYNFAYQLIGGIAYDVNPNWSLSGELRYFGLNDQDLSNSDYSFKTPFQTIDVLFGATYHF